MLLSEGDSEAEMNVVPLCGFLMILHGPGIEFRLLGEWGFMSRIQYL